MGNKPQIPALRFPGFKGEWEEKKLGDISTITSGGTPHRSKSEFWGGDIPWITTSLIDFNIIEEAEEFITQSGLTNSSAKLFPKGTLLMAMYGQGKTRGKVAMLGTKASTNQACAGIIPDDKQLLNIFLFQNLQKRYDEIRGLSNLGGQENLSGELIKSIEIIFPTLPEQKKIASFFSAIDKKLAQLKQKKQLLEEYKKGMMQKLFSQEIRFKDAKGRAFGDWEEKKLGEILHEHRKRNTNNEIFEVFSVAKNKGIINQIEHLGRSYASKDTSNYKVVLPNDIVYTKSPTSDFPYGIIKQNKLNRIGIVSVLYGVFSPDNKFLGTLLDYYFSVPENTLNYLHPLVKKGAKNTMNISNDDFLNGAKIAFPDTLEEQTKIARFLSAIDEKINQCAIQIEKTMVWKKGLLQQMFC